MKHLLKRLAGLSARGWWDWWRLWWQHRNCILNCAPLKWDRDVTLNFGGREITGICRVRFEGGQGEVEFELGNQDPDLTAAAAVALSDLGRLTQEVPVSKTIEAFH